MTQDEWRRRRDVGKRLEAMELEAIRACLPGVIVEIKPWGISLIEPTPEQNLAADHFRAGFQQGFQAARKLTPESQPAA